MSMLKPSKKLTEDILSLFGEKFLTTGTPELDQKKIAKVTTGVPRTSSSCGVAQYSTKLSNLLSESDLDMLYANAKTLFEAGIKYQEECLAINTYDTLIRRYLNRNYQLIHPKDWIVKVNICYSHYSRAEGYKLQGIINIFQTETGVDPVAIFDIDDNSSDYYSTTKDTELLKRVDELKGFFGITLGEESVLYPLLMSKLLNLSNYTRRNCSQEFSWVINSCPQVVLPTDPLQPNVSEDF